MTIDYQVFDLSGSYYDLGRVQGERTERFAVPEWWPAPPPLSFARACEAQIAALFPPLLDELRGYAEAQALPYEELLRGVCRRSMRVRALAATPPARDEAPAYPEGGCSSLAVVGADGHVRVGRNYDFHTAQRVRQRLRLRPRGGRPTVGMRGSVPGGRYDGVNDAGLFICLHVALSDEPETIRPGVPFHLLPRLVLETCTSTRAAVDMLSRVQHLHPFNYLIADPSGDLAVVEAHPERVRVAETSTEAVAATNHYRHPEMARLQHGRKLTHSQQRLECLQAHSRQRDAAGVLAALADHPSNLCGHAGGHTTLWSLQADLSARTLAYARGAPCETAFEAVAWPGE
jgi:hypothetical protein